MKTSINFGETRFVKGILMLVFLLLGLVLFSQSALAQRGYGQYDKGQTTTKPDDTYGKGGTTEQTPYTVKPGGTVSKEDQSFTQTVWKDKDGRVRHVSDGRFEVIFAYDNCGRRTSATVFEIAGGKRTQRYRVTKKYEKSCEDAEGDLVDYNDYINIEDILDDFGLLVFPNVVYLAAPQQKDTSKSEPKNENAAVKMVAANGLRTFTFDTVSGRVIVNLPDDMRAGDTISGTVVAEPKGQTLEERAKSAAELHGYVVAISNASLQRQKTPPMIIFDLAKVMAQPGRLSNATKAFATPNSAKVNLGLYVMPNENTSNGVGGRTGTIQCINESCSPISQLVFDVPKQPLGVVIAPDPKTTPTFVIPSLGQTGRSIAITGHFDGDSSNTKVDFQPPIVAINPPTTEAVPVDWNALAVVAESPRQVVVMAPANVTGPIRIRLKEGPTETTAAFRNVGVSLTAPKTNLLKGENTELTIQVSGLQGIKEPIPITIESRGVITMAGGTYQPFTIQPSQVGNDGRYTTTRGITGVQSGGWTATATVKVKRYDTCLEDDGDPLRVLLFDVSTGDYLFQTGSQTLGDTARAAQNVSAIGTMAVTPMVTALNGTGKVTMKSCILTLQNDSPEGRIVVKIDQCARIGFATVEVPSTKTKFKVTDRNMKDNTCSMH